MIPGVPYDAEIEYLESTGTQWIDTGLPYSHDISVSTSFQSKVTSGDGYLFGVLWASGGSSTIRRWAVNVNSNNVLTPQFYRTMNVNRAISSGTNELQANATSIVLNGASVSVTTSTFDPSVDVNIYLFARHTYAPQLDPNPVTGIVKAVVHGFKAWNNGILVRDFIPVRVGQTGYMYDRVTRRLFGNKGTGSFVLGPDVAKPVMGLWGMRKFYNTRDYVQDGLVAHFDGICNGPNGEHITTGYKWYDLTGNETELHTWGNLRATWNDNYVIFRGWMNNAAKQRDYTKDGFTQELVTYGGWANPNINMNQCFCNTNILNTSTGQYRFACFGKYDASFTSKDFTGSISNKAITCVVQSNGIGTAYIDGGVIVVPMSSAAKPFTVLSGSKSMGIGSNANANYSKGIHAYRIYNRALSLAEIAHNYQIDKARFNLP